MVGERGDLGKVGHHQHLAIRRDLRERRAEGEGRSPTDARVDLVEDHGGRAAHGDQSQGQHRPGQLAAGGHLGQRQDGFARVGPEQERDVLAGVALTDGHFQAGLGHGQGLQTFLDSPAQLGGATPAGGADI